MTKNIINILPENISNKIAAGEVVQRPESVLKELLENALDAESKNIDVIVKQAGKSLIQVVDDGKGMTEDDALICIQRHATSKIKDVRDLESINTFGFRGEALSSIAAVSKFEIRTEMQDDDIGTLIITDGGENVIIEKGSFSKGTSVAVKNLFFNVPARRNFLKTNATELKHLIDTFKKIALSYPGISFKFYNDDDLLYNLKGDNIYNRMRELFNDKILDSVIEVNEPTDFLSVSGFIAKPTFLKRSKAEQYLFINKRFVVSKLVNHAVFSAYESIVEKGDYPFFALFLNIDPYKVDVNVHPTKREIKFDDEKSIYSLVNAIVKKSIGSYDLVPQISFNERDGKEKLRFTEYSGSAKNDFSDRPVNTGNKIIKNKSAFSDDDIDQLFDSLNPGIKKNAANLDREVSHPFDEKSSKEIYHVDSRTIEQSTSTESTHASFIVALHNKYILSQIKSGLMIIDAHVAAERILYEKALKSLNTNMPFSQQLLFSQTHQVDPGDFTLIKELNPHFSKLGFELKFFGNNTIVIDGVPSDIKMGNEVNILMEILDEYKTNQREKDIDIREKMAASYACKAAIKAGDKLDEKEMRLLVDQLFATTMPYVCPHGRPIVIKIPLDEFDKRFGRT
ncbi:MAG: DNA mismatch repair endonuclease MutL [Melioribacteraceae bacterium]|nr:DNA mismatch repair endonuclease MutL [Melioribacteraceae bacterium]